MDYARETQQGRPRIVPKQFILLQRGLGRRELELFSQSEILSHPQWDAKTLGEILIVRSPLAGTTVSPRCVSRGLSRAIRSERRYDILLSARSVCWTPRAVR